MHITNTHIINGYTILEIYNILSVDECNELIRFSQSRSMESSHVVDYSNQSDRKIDITRNSSNVWLRDTDHPIVQKIAGVSSVLTGFPFENQEMLQVVKYESGGKYEHHYDAPDISDMKVLDKLNRGSGQRQYTFLIYLNDEFEGGETEFVNIGLKIKPETGKAILFRSTTQDQVVIKNSLHTGCTVNNGNKWICTKWTRLLKWDT